MIKVEQVTDLYNKYEIKQLATLEMEKHLARAYEAMNALAVEEHKKLGLPLASDRSGWLLGSVACSWRFA